MLKRNADYQFKSRYFKDWILYLPIKTIDFIQSIRKLTILTKMKNVLLSFKNQFIFVPEPNDWSISWDGFYITNNLNKLNLLKSTVGSQLFVN